MEEKILQAISEMEERITQKITDVEERMSQKITDVEEKMTQKIDKIEERQNKMEKDLQNLPDLISNSVEKTFVKVDYRIQQLIKADEQKQFDLLDVNRRLHKLESANGILEPIFK